MSVGQMANFINADSLSFISIDGLYRELGEAKRSDDAPKYCDACFTGDYPTTLTDFDEHGLEDQVSLLADRVVGHNRQEERREGKEGVRKWRSRWPPNHTKKKKK